MNTAFAGSLIESPVDGDIESIVTLLMADLGELRLPPDPVRLHDVASRLVNEPTEVSFVRVARASAGQAASGLVVAHRWLSAKFGGDAWWLDTLHVGETLRRQGMGARLVQSLVDHARQTGGRGIDLEAYRMNAPASYLYRSLGFRRLGRERYSLSLSSLMG